ncbi:helix-turn-helix domain-containing protein [Paenibacillus piri]|uniref:Helix-turn-helix domain-containing protein n=1 Tax=Paenibacillus piri TaxID=2547395 RepID=A0A4R5KY29_9BACL|nr:helix-turn-helix domain-containing protein [Paenibacillus piri]TDG00129.1 helix-turn-helix domain-containing protein [Paenibacillus piri]
MLNVIPRFLGSNRRSVRFYKLFLPYLFLVVFFLLVIGSVVYVNIISALQKEVEQAQLSAVAQIRDTMDTRLRELQRIALQISTNPLLTPYSLSQIGYDSYQAVSELNKYRTSNSFVHNIVLNYAAGDNNRIFSATGVYEETEFFKNIYRFDNWGHAPLSDTIRSLNGPVIRPAEKVFISNGTQESRFATYMYPLPAYSGKPYGVVMFMLDAGMLQSMSEHLVSRPGSSLYLVDEQGHVIFQTEQAPELNGQIASAMPDKDKADSISAKSIDGVTYSVIRQGLTYNGWSFITTVPTSLFLEKVEQNRRLFGIILLVLLALGAAASFILADSNYRKLRQLVQLFSDKKNNGTKAPAAMDELVYLSNAIREVSGEDSMMAKLKSKRGLIRENVLLSLLKNKFQQQDELKHTLELADIRFDYSSYVSVLLVIDDYAGFQSLYPGSMQELFKFSILNAAEELAMEIGRGYGVSILDDRGIALIINIRDAEGYKSRLQVFSTNIQTFFNTHYKFTLSIGIGQIYNELRSAAVSFEEARRALLYRFVRGNNQVLFYDNLQPLFEEHKHAYPHELEDHLLKSIRQGNTDEAERSIRGIIGSIRSLSVTPEAAQLACNGLLHLLMKVSDEVFPGGQLELQQKSDSLKLHNAETIDELEKQMSGICRTLCEHVSGRKESRNFKLRDDILQYLQEHYMNSSLTLDTIADRFGLSSSYITRFVKDQTGYSLIRYLDLLRMDKAKELLLSEHLNLSEITKEVGYVDVSNFIRKFKKTEGVTPEQYRKLRAKA